MTIKERLEAAKAELATAKAALEKSGTAEDAAALEKAIGNVEELQKAADEAERANGLLKSMGSLDGAADGGEQSKTGTRGEKMAAEVVAKHAKLAEGERLNLSIKAAGDANTAPALDGGAAILRTEVREDIIQGPRRALTVAQLFAQETTDKAAVTYFVEGPVEGDPATVAEGAAFPQLHFGEPTPQTDALKKIGCLYKDTDELLEDAPRLAASFDNRADYLMDIREEDQLLSGDGTGNNIKGLLNRSGLQTMTVKGIDGVVDAIAQAKTAVSKNTPGFVADGLLVNDEDWTAIKLLKDANKQYLAGGPFIGAYGNGGYVAEPPLWGLRVVPTSAIAKGTMVIGAFFLGGSVIRKGARVVDVSNSNEDDFKNGLVAFRPSERIALAVRYPAAFVKLTVEAGA